AAKLAAGNNSSNRIINSSSNMSSSASLDKNPFTAGTTTVGATGTRKVFIPRDFTNGLELRFSTAFPVQLQGRIPEETFVAVVTNINEILTAAERGSPAVYMESIFACLTGYLLYLCIDTHYEKSLKQVSRLVAEYNRTTFEPNRLMLVDPSDRGLRVLEIVLLND
ncbi:hypothetical protein BOX15_Mlig030077g1, partial [Macrostomum lignano]